MPFGQPLADWLLLGPEVELRHTRYDLPKAAERIRATNYPQAEDCSKQRPPTPHGEGHARGVLPRGAEVGRVAGCGRFDQSVMPAFARVASRKNVSPYVRPKVS